VEPYTRSSDNEAFQEVEIGVFGTAYFRYFVLE
jgi:hypothetical protein